MLKSESELKTERYNIFLVEDNKTDQMAFKRLIQREDLPYNVTVASSVEEAKDILQPSTNNSEFDIVILDYILEDNTAFDVLDYIQEDIPIIVHSGAGSEEIAAKAMKLGASDYLVKDVNQNYLKLIPMAIEKAISNYKIKKRLHETRILQNAILENSFEAFLVCNPEATIMFANDYATRLTKYSLDELYTLEVTKLIDNKEFVKYVSNTVNNGTPLKNIKVQLIPKNGALIPAEMTLVYMEELDKLLVSIHDLRPTEITLTKLDGFIEFVQNQTKISLFKMTNSGPSVIETEQISEHEKLDKDITLKMGIYYTTALVQGANRNTQGLFGPFPVPELEDHLALVYSFFFDDTSLSSDPRYNGKNYAMITLIMPETLEQLFLNRESINSTIQELLDQFKTIEDISLLELKNMKNKIIKREVQK